MSDETKKKSSPLKLAFAIVAAVGSLSLAGYRYYHFRQADFPLPVGHHGHSHALNFHKTVDGRQLLWASGPREGEEGEWFDVTESPLDVEGYQYGIGKDSIPSIDNPEFVAIDRREELLEFGIDDSTSIIGYVHNNQAKAYPVGIMNRHELVNDFVGGKPVTVGW